MSVSTQEFGKWRGRLWPVQSYELRKLIPMVLMFFFILFNYTVLRDTKDTLVVTAAKGSQVIPFLKFWGVMPCAILFMIVYAKMSNKLSRTRLFYATVAPFLVFFASFALVLYPFREALLPYALCDYLQQTLPQGFQGLIDILRNWPYAAFYIMSELWGSVGISLGFWGFSIFVFSISESKRFYPIFAMFANVALIASGFFIKWSSQARQSIIASDPWQVSLNYMMSLVVIAGLLVMGIYWWINRYVLTDPRFCQQTEKTKSKKPKPKLSMKESFLLIVKSRYLGCIAMLVFGYGVAINLVEVTWKNQLHELYPDYNTYSAFMGGFSLKTGIVTILITFLFGGSFIRRFGWGKTALITPVMLLGTGVIFFAFIIFKEQMAPIAAYLGATPLIMAVQIGMIQNIASKSSKYSFFDPTKEMAYIPIDPELKVKGKAAVDVVGARMGKSVGALIQQALLLVFVSVGAITPYVAMILFVVIFLWIVAARALEKRFTALTQKKEDADEDRDESRVRVIGAGEPQPTS